MNQTDQLVIATIFRNEMIKDAVTDLLENRDGLILGICNGFPSTYKTRTSSLWKDMRYRRRYGNINLQQYK